MNKTTTARPLLAFATALLAFFVLTPTSVALASTAASNELDGVTTRIVAGEDSFAASSWVPLEVQVNNKNPNHNIRIVEAGLTALPDGLELKSGDALKTSQASTELAAGTQSYTTVHSLSLRKTAGTGTASPTGSGTTSPAAKATTSRTTSTSTPKTADTSHAQAIVVAIAAVGALSLLAARRLRRGGTLVLLLVGIVAATGLTALPARQAAAATTAHTANCTLTVTIDGTAYTFNGYVTYTYDSATPTPTPDPNPQTVSIAVQKTWADGSLMDKDGKPLGNYARPASATVALLDPSGAEVATTDLTADGQWSGSFANLPARDANGTNINYASYTVVEKPVPAGFTCEPAHPTGGTSGILQATLTNVPTVRSVYVPANVSIKKLSTAQATPTDPAQQSSQDVLIPGTKFNITRNFGQPGALAAQQTTDANGIIGLQATAPDERIQVVETEARAGYHNNSATFVLNVEAEAIPQSVVLDAQGGAWVKAHKLSTRVSENDVLPEGLVIEQPSAAGASGTNVPQNENTYTLRNLPLCDLRVSKNFVVPQGASLPTNFSVTLTYANAAGQQQTIELKKGDKYDQDPASAKSFNWVVPGIPAGAQVTLSERNYAIAGHGIAKTDVQVSRADPSNASGNFLTPMTAENGVQVHNGGTTVSFAMPAHLDPDPSWRYPQGSANEGTLGTQSAQVSFTNEYYATESRSLRLTKTWNDSNNAAGIRPSAGEYVAALALKADGIDITQAGYTPGIGAIGENVYTAMWTGLPKFKSDGSTPISYTVEEAPVAGYVAGEINGSSSSENGFSLTNTLGVVVDITKEWHHNVGDDVQIHVLNSSGASVDVLGFGAEEFVIPEGDYKAAVTKSSKLLPAFDAQGQRIEYQAFEPTGAAPAIQNFVPVAWDTNSVVDGVVHGSATVVNVLSPSTSISGTKLWRDGNREHNNASEVKLGVQRRVADSEEPLVPYPIAASDVSWDDSTYTISNLPKYYKDLIEYEYFAIEEQVEDYLPPLYYDANWNANDYDGAPDGGSIFNFIEQQHTTVSFTVEWDDDGNRDGKRPSTIKLQAFARDSSDNFHISPETSFDVSPTESSQVFTFTNVDRYDRNGAEIPWQVWETNVPEGYTCTYYDARGGNPQQDPGHGYFSGMGAPIGGKIVNKHVPQKINVAGTITWSDATAPAGTRPDRVTVRLHADGKELTSTTVDATSADANGNWTYSFADRYKYRDGGTAIVYTVTEDAVDDYEHAISGLNITNTYAPRMTTVDVEKVWEDSGNADGMRPTSVTVSLMAGNPPAPTGDTLTLNADNSWEGTFTVNEYDASNNKIAYTVAEPEMPEGYEAAVTGSAEHGFTITNTHEAETTSVHARVEWNDNNNQDGKRPQSVQVTLLANGVPAGQAITLNEENNWTGTFQNLLKKRNGTDITYLTSEVASSVLTGTDGPGTYSFTQTGTGTQQDPYVITNTHTPEKIAVRVEKRWCWNGANGTSIPNSISVTATDKGGKTYELTLESAKQWSTEIANVNKYWNGSINVLTFNEQRPSGSNWKKLSEGGSLAIGRCIILNSETTTLRGGLHWPKSTQMIDTSLFPRPQSITVTLQLFDQPNGTWFVVDSQEVSRNNSTDSTADDWLFSFEDVALYNDYGTEARYRVVATTPGGYTSSGGTKEDGYAISYAYDAITLRLTKTWDDGGNTSQRPGTSDFGNYLELYKDGTKLNVTPTVMYDSTKPNEYSVRWMVPNASYTVVEKDVPGYTMVGSVGGNGSTGNPFTITNRRSTNGTSSLNANAHNSTPPPPPTEKAQDNNGNTEPMS